MSDNRHKFQILMKKAFNVVSTFKNTPWYNETNGTTKKTTKVEDINIETPPLNPVWKDTSVNDLSEYDLSDSDFASDISFTDLHIYSGGDIYTTNGERSPGIYLDNTETVALFVRLKLDKMERDSSNNLDPSAIVYTKYSSDDINPLISFSVYLLVVKLN